MVLYETPAGRDNIDLYLETCHAGDNLVIMLYDDDGSIVRELSPEQCDALRIALSDHLATLIK